MPIKLIFKITVYHGTDVKNVGGIIKNGFDINTISCATQDKEFAKGYGNSLLTFKYPFELRFSFKTIEEDLEYLKRFIYDYFSKSLMTGVSGYRPMRLKIWTLLYNHFSIHLFYYSSVPFCH